MSIQEYVAELARLLGVEARPRHPILDEVRDHLEAATAGYRRVGLSEEQALRRALSDFGPPDVVAAAFRREAQDELEDAVVSMAGQRVEGAEMFEVEVAGVEFRPQERELIEKAREQLETRSEELPEELRELQVRLGQTWRADTGPALLLKERAGERRLCVYVGLWEATSIAYSLHEVGTPRPMTHDFVGNLLRALEGVARADRVVITSLEGGTFYARLELDQEGTTVPVDCRPSDGIAVAVRLGLPIFVAQELEPHFEAA